jgi:hypothetical protein
MRSSVPSCAYGLSLQNELFQDQKRMPARVELVAKVDITVLTRDAFGIGNQYDITARHSNGPGLSIPA